MLRLKNYIINIHALIKDYRNIIIYTNLKLEK